MTGRALVLVVEDEPDVRELIADVLAEHGYEIEVAPDGAAALQLSDQRKYDLILSDLRMPKMDGAALYWALQLRHGSAMPRMIYVTGQAHSLDYAGFLAASRVPVLSKPFSPEDLRQAVRQALAKNNTPASDGQSPRPSVEGPYMDQGAGARSERGLHRIGRMFDTKIAIVVREDLAVVAEAEHHRVPVRAGSSAPREGLLGEPYEDAAGNTYNPLAIQPMIMLLAPTPTR